LRVWVVRLAQQTPTYRELWRHRVYELLLPCIDAGALHPHEEPRLAK
jgi:hypothetical protein